MIRLALYQPDIPQNVGAAMRLCACLGIPLDIIQPCGFPWDDRKIRTSGMDYIDQAVVHRHMNMDAFDKSYPGQRRILMTTKGAIPYTDFVFQPGDIVLAGRESAGVPDEIHNSVDARVVIPMQAGTRSLNVIISSAMIVGEALRQIQQQRMQR